MDSIAENIDIKKKFVEEYKTKVFPFLKGHEVLRANLNKKCNFNIAITWLIYLTITAIVYFIPESNDVLLLSLKTFYFMCDIKHN